MIRKLIVFIVTVQISLISFSTAVQAQNAGDVLNIFGAIVGESIRQDQANKAQKQRNDAQTQQQRAQKSAEVAQKKAFAKRVQSALKSLGFYQMTIDGDWGSGTRAAVAAYSKSFNLYIGEFNEQALLELEGYAAEGWRSIEEIDQARSGGFYSRQEMVRANEAGFSQRSIWVNAKQAGFDNANEFTIYQKSNFSSPADFLAAQNGGFSNSENYLAAKNLGFATAQEFQDFRASGYENKAEFDAAAKTRRLAANAQLECEKTSANREWIAAGAACSLAKQFNPNNLTIAILSNTAQSSLGAEKKDFEAQLKISQEELSKLLANPNELEGKAFQDSLIHARERISELDANVAQIETYQENIKCSVAFNSDNWKQAALLCADGASRDVERRSKNESWSKLAASMNDMAAIAKRKLTEEAEIVAINRNKLALNSAKKRGQELINSVEDYSSRGNQFEAGLDMVRSLVALKAVMNSNEATLVEGAVNRLAELVKVDEGFVADQSAFIEASKQADIASALAAREGLEEVNLFLNNYVSSNLMADNIAQLLDLMDRVDSTLKLGNASQMTSALANADAILQRENLKGNLAEFVSNLGAVVVSQDTLQAQQARTLADNIEVQEAQNSALILVADVERYSIEGGSFSSPIKVAGALVKLRSVVDSQDIQIIINRTDALNDILQEEDEFNSVKQQRTINSAESRQNATVIAAEAGRSYSAFMVKYISENITSSNIGDMLDLQSQLEESLNNDDWQAIIIANTNIEDFLAKNNLSKEFINFVEAARSAKGDGVELSQAGNGIVINAANKELLEGNPNDILVLKNASGSSANIGKNLFGKLVFDNESANVCWLHKEPTASIASLLLEREINELGVSRVIKSPVCNKSLFENTDLILVQRGEFLELPVALARPAILAFEDGRLEQLAKITNDDVLSFQASLSQSVEILKAEIMTEEREGYGLISLPNGREGICMGTNTDLLAHSNLLYGQGEILGLYFSGNTDLLPVNLERAFVMAQRQLCSGIYSDAAGMKLLLSGLERENIPHLLVPLWFETSAYDASVAAIEETEKQRKARLLAQRQKAESEAELRSQQERTDEKLRLARQEKSRDENRDAAMGNLKILTDTSYSFYEGELSEFAQLFPQSAALKNQQGADKWNLTDKSIKLVDFGTAIWRSRRVSAILAEVRYNSENAVLGQYREDCIIVGYLIDDEFGLVRDSVEAPCSVSSTINDWKISHKFESGWFAK